MIDIAGPFESEIIARNSRRRICFECNKPLPPNRKKFDTDECGSRFRQRKYDRKVEALRAFGDLEPIDEGVLRVVDDPEDLLKLRDRIEQRLKEKVPDKFGTMIRRDILECWQEDTAGRHWSGQRVQRLLAS